MALPYLCFVLFCVQVAYPLYSSLYALFSKQGSEKFYDEITQWTVYWILYLFYSWLESNVIFFLPEYFPLYGEIKLVLSFWLVSPDFLGASWIWFSALDRFKRADESVVEFIETRCSRLMEFALGQQSDCVPSTAQKYSQARTTPVFPSTPAKTTMERKPSADLTRPKPSTIERKGSSDPIRQKSTTMDPKASSDLTYQKPTNLGRPTTIELAVDG